jgi:O-methyltransferase
VTARLGPGVEGLRQLLAEEGPGLFDFAFIDADKRNYQVTWYSVGAPC